MVQYFHNFIAFFIANTFRLTRYHKSTYLSITLICKYLSATINRITPPAFCN